MVECELYAFADNPAVLYGFNRYMVECEYECKVAREYIIISFNRYMVECECRLVKNS